MPRLENNGEGKIIKDPVHGFMDLNKMQVELLSQPEVQRMTWIKQIGLGLLVYPGGHHTRLEHCLGTSYLCKKIGKTLELDEKERKLLEAAGMLHDIGHPPFSHTVEKVMEKDHMEATKELILGEKVLDLSGAGKIPEVLKKHGLDPKRVADLVTGDFKGKKYLADIISSQMDADQLDYLVRDAHHTGVSYGSIETDWIINVMEINDERLTYREKGIDALEDCIIARDHMYSSVYSHKTSCIAEKMLLRAVERHLKSNDQKGEDIFWMTDGELMQVLSNTNAFSKEMVSRIKNRDLYKQAYALKDTEVSEDSRIERISNGSEEEIEGRIAELADVNEDSVIVHKEREVTKELEPRLREFDIRITLDSGEVVPLEEVSRTVSSLRKKEPVRNLLSVYTPEEHRSRVGEKAKGYFGL
ncbi:MAG: HD domain-containing protein [Candidatus Aenigmatarchaeota archaeon]